MRPGASPKGGASAGRLGSRAAGVLFAAAWSALALTHGAIACTAVPDPVRDINAVDYHTGPGGMSVDAVLRSRNDTAMEPERTFVRVVSQNADHYVADNKTAAAACALSALRDWANGGALLGVMANAQADRERAGLTSGIAFAYLKSKSAASAEDQQAIEAWLDKLAGGIEAAFGDPARPANRSLALAGLATMAIGAAIDNRERLRFGEAAYEQSVAAIDQEGVLEVEMGGGERALFDQDFALGNLVMTAELAAKLSGEDWYSRHDGAIHHLADRVLDGLRDPSWFAEKTGKQQFLPSGRDLAWIAFYARRFPERFAGRVPDGAIFQSPRLGGDLTVLAEKWVKG
jgi:poly(beta-D-mannuronate) lyase